MKKMYLDVVHIYIFIFFKLDKWLQSYDLKCINMYNLDGGCTSANFLTFPNFSNHFTPMWLKMTHNCKFHQKSGLDWVKTANLACFSIFSPKLCWFSSAIYMQSVIVGFLVVVVVVKLIKFIMIIAIPVAVGAQPRKVQFPLI